MKYFVISNSDGDTYIEEFDKEGLLGRLDPEDYGPIEFLEDLNERNTNYWDGKILIIKGEILVPKPKKVVEEYDV